MQIIKLSELLNKIQTIVENEQTLNISNVVNEVVYGDENHRGPIDNDRLLQHLVAGEINELFHQIGKEEYGDIENVLLQVNNCGPIISLVQLIKIIKITKEIATLNDSEYPYNGKCIARFSELPPE